MTTTTPDAILRHYSATMTTGPGGERVSAQAITRDAARACVSALTAAGIEASWTPDDDDRSMSWVYVGGAIEPAITADTITDRQRARAECARVIARSRRPEDSTPDSLTIPPALRSCSAGVRLSA